MLKKILPAFFLIGLLSLPIYAQGQSSRSEQELQLGMAEYESWNLAEAIKHFERAVQLNPGSIKSRFALAEAYTAQYIDVIETDSDEVAKANSRLIYRAIEEYKAVVAIEPTNTQALNNIGAIYRRLFKFKDADVYFRESLKIDPKNKEALYRLAVLDWERSFQFRMDTRKTLHLKTGIPLITSDACSGVSSENLERVEDGIQLLTRLSTIANFSEVPAWLSLLYRERADIRCGDHAAYGKDLQSADDSVRLACAARSSGAKPVPESWPSPPPWSLEPCKN